ncbi:MAG: hypothetical protein C0404_07835 [Verrucomicrobia bacterium]|nr:hypothetical protein [Verrucomicrobiota bacterium]
MNTNKEFRSIQAIEDEPRASMKWLYVVGCLLFLATFLGNAWIHEDAFITFRSVEQVYAGNGPVWNPHERVQTYTHPLWFMGLVAIRAVSSNQYLNAIALSLACGLATLWVSARLFRSPVKWSFLVMTIVASKCLMDYSSSGLEAPMVVLLLTFMFAAFIGGSAPVITLTLGSLLVLCRHDLALMVLPLALCVTVETWINKGWSAALKNAVVGALPFLAWTLFALVYYGFALPNSAYAKLGHKLPFLATGDQPGLLWYGSAYVITSVSWDLIIPASALAAIVTLWRRSVERRTHHLLAASGCLLYVFYIVAIGGDYMGGRFLIAPLWMVLIIFFHAVPTLRAASLLACVALLVAILSPVSPLKVILHDVPTCRMERGITDEHAGYFQATSLRSYVMVGFPESLRAAPDLYNWYELGTRFKQVQGVVEASNMGILGYYAGTETILIDRYGITDPLIARLPATKAKVPGHYVRAVPAGYIPSVMEHTNLIQDAQIARLHNDIRVVTQGKLFTLERFRLILKLNMH